MSDTTTITPEERENWRALVMPYPDGTIGNQDKRMLRLLDAIEQAEASADELETYIAKLVCELTDGRLSEPYDISVITDEVEAIYRAHTEEAVVKATAKAEADESAATDAEGEPERSCGTCSHVHDVPDDDEPSPCTECGQDPELPNWTDGYHAQVNGQEPQSAAMQ